MSPYQVGYKSGGRLGTCKWAYFDFVASCAVSVVI